VSSRTPAGKKKKKLAGSLGPASPKKNKKKNRPGLDLRPMNKNNILVIVFYIWQNNLLFNIKKFQKYSWVILNLFIGPSHFF
jgi:hypothetical protein